MANRIIPPDPETNRQSQAKKLEEAQKIAAISSVDPDAQAKKRRFQEMMGVSEEKEKITTTPSPPTPAPQPSPFQPSFYQQNTSTDLNLVATPSPYNSAPPDLTTPSPQAEDLMSDEGLPRSPDYWSQVDLPDQPINESPELTQETSESQEQDSTQSTEEQTTQSWPQELLQRKKEPFAAKKKTSQQGFQELPVAPEKKLEPSPFGLPGKPVSKKGAATAEPPPFITRKAEEKENSFFAKKPSEESQAPPLIKKPSEEKESSPFTQKTSEEKESSLFAKKPSEEYTPPAKFWETQPEKIQGEPVSRKEKEKNKEKMSPDASPVSNLEKPLDKEQQGPSKEFSPFFQKSESGGESGQDGSRGRASKQTMIDIVQPALPGFPGEIHSEAASAATAAASYLRPETIPLFYQMVGTIFVMTNQGISTTEILLNNPAFAGSKFFGASIEIIKYSSAPDSLNIRLSGSNEAVTAFNQNIPGLMAAFQTGGFRFRIGRIETAYAAEKPLFHRKEEKGNNSDGQKNEGG